MKRRGTRYGIIGNSVERGRLQAKPVYKDFRPGDIRHSLADIGKAKSLLGYAPGYSVGGGLEKAGKWYIK